MRHRTLRLALPLALVLFPVVPWLFAEDDKKPEPQAVPPSLQQQIDELKKGQEGLLKEVEEIKQLLQQRPGRAEFAAKTAAPTVSSVNVHGEPFRGDQAARVAIMEFSDFDCSFCGKYARETYPRLDQDYVKPGKVRYFFRDLPGPGETNAFVKARAARCAGDQAKFWEMHDLLFATQAAPAGDLAPLGQTLGLDLARFNECLASEKYAENIERSVAGARRMGIMGTPAFIIGILTEDGNFIRVTKLLVGAQTYDDLKSVLDELLTNPAKH
jgi:protein-disulfide isomerase